jgi:hypothetical protein
MSSRTRSFAGLLIVPLLAAACDGDHPTPTALTEPPASISAAVTESSIDICHLTGSGGSVKSVSLSNWPAHRSHGDYALQWQVDPQTGIAGDGIHFVRISDAVSAADSTRRKNSEKSSAACRITISVAPGNYTGSFDVISSTLERFPIFMGVPDVTLRGALEMPNDDKHRASGAGTAGASIIKPDRGLTATETMVVIADDTSGYHGNGVTVENFRFRSGYDTLGTVNGGIGVGALRVRDILVRGNHFERTVFTAIDLRASRGVIENNYANFLGTACGVCLAGPGSYDVNNNRIVEGGFVGLFAAPVVVLPNFPMGTIRSIVVAPYVAPAVAADTASINNNDISNQRHHSNGFGTGIRLVTFSSGAAVNTAQSGKIRLSRNTLFHNTFAISIDANTPLNASPTVPGNIDVTLTKNVIGPSCRNNLLVSFTRISHTLGTTTQGYLLNSTYTVSLGGDTPWSSAWYDNPSGNGDTLRVDGVEFTGTHASPSDPPSC